MQKARPLLDSLVLRRESPNLDLLRSVAVLSVLTDHIFATLGIAPQHPFLLDLGFWGVLLFFVHTSLVLMMSLERLPARGWQLFSSFYLRRFFRIYPLSMVTVALVIMLHIPHRSWASEYHPLNLRTIISNVLLCQNLTRSRSVISPMWSLPYEVQMYLLLPPLFILVRRMASWRTLVGIWLFSVGAGFLQLWVGQTIVGRHLRLDRLSVAEYAPCFLAGVIAYYILQRHKEAILPFSCWPFTVGLISSIFLLIGTGRNYVGWCGCLLIALAVTQCRESPYRRLNVLTHRVAKYSYGLYLAQIPVLWLVFVRLEWLPFSLQCCIFLVLIVTVPIACYHVIEEPLIGLGIRLSASRIDSPRIAEHACASAR